METERDIAEDPAVPVWGRVQAAIAKHVEVAQAVLSDQEPGLAVEEGPVPMVILEYAGEDAVVAFVLVVPIMLLLPGLVTVAVAAAAVAAVPMVAMEVMGVQVLMELGFLEVSLLLGLPMQELQVVPGELMEARQEQQPART
jgi:hypothetical protein